MSALQSHNMKSECLQFNVLPAESSVMHRPRVGYTFESQQEHFKFNLNLKSFSKVQVLAGARGDYEQKVHLFISTLMMGVMNSSKKGCCSREGQLWWMKLMRRPLMWEPS